MYFKVHQQKFRQMDITIGKVNILECGPKTYCEHISPLEITIMVVTFLLSPYILEMFPVEKF